MAAKETKPSSESLSIEAALERIEKLAEEMESDKLSLDALIEKYAEGTKLVRICQEKLDAAEQRIKVITRNAQGPNGLAEFESEPND
jgi:exodeoxyribonuclease VII small subunit